MACDFSVAVNIVSLAGDTLIDLNDQASGYTVMVDPIPLDEPRIEGKTSSPFVNGGSAAWGRDDESTLAVVVQVRGSSWPEVTARRRTMKAAYKASMHFYLDVVIQGVTTRYRARIPSVGGQITTENLMHNFIDLVLTFPVQPNPTVTGA